MDSLARSYQQELNVCRHAFDTLDLQKEKGYLFKFTTFSANVQNILPQIPLSQHEALFHQLLLQQVYANFDQHFISANELARVKGPARRCLKKKNPHIYCSFHLGSYRLLTSYLFRQGIDLVLMVGSKAYSEQGQSFLETIDQIRQKYNLSNSFQLLDAEQPSSTLNAIRQLKAGKSLVIFTDGLTADTGFNRSENKELRIQFGQNQLWARKGIGFLSHLTQTPIVPVIGYREADLNNALLFLNPIRPQQHPNREAYCHLALQAVYNAFWPYLKKYPAQWEAWNYVHRFLDHQLLQKQTPTLQLPTPCHTQRVSFNQDRYTICDLEEAPVLYDRHLYVTYEISPNLRDFLLQITTIDNPQETLGESLFADLLDKHILS